MIVTFLAGVRVPSTSKRTSVFFRGRSERAGNWCAMIWKLGFLVTMQDLERGYVMAMRWQILERAIREDREFTHKAVNPNFVSH